MCVLWVILACLHFNFSSNRLSCTASKSTSLSKKKKKQTSANVFVQQYFPTHYIQIFISEITLKCIIRMHIHMGVGWIIIAMLLLPTGIWTHIKINFYYISFCRRFFQYAMCVWAPVANILVAVMVLKCVEFYELHACMDCKCNGKCRYPCASHSHTLRLYLSFSSSCLYLPVCVCVCLLREYIPTHIHTHITY